MVRVRAEAPGVRTGALGLGTGPSLAPGRLACGGASPGAAAPTGHPVAGAARARCDTFPMPVLDPNPQNGQKKMLLVFGAFFAIFIVIGVIATVLAP